MSHCSAGEQGVIVLGDSIGRCTSVTSLSLSDMDINDRGLKALCTPLALCTTLRNLALHRTDLMLNFRPSFGDEGIIAFSTKVLPVCTNLVKLSLSGQEIGDKGLMALSEALRPCTRLQELRQDSCHQYCSVEPSCHDAWKCCCCGTFTNLIMVTDTVQISKQYRGERIRRRRAHGAFGLCPLLFFPDGASYEAYWRRKCTEEKRGWRWKKQVFVNYVHRQGGFAHSQCGTKSMVQTAGSQLPRA